MKIKKLNESMTTSDEFFDIQDIVSEALNSIGGDMDDVTGGITSSYDEDRLLLSLYSTVDRKDARKFKKNFLTTIENSLSQTRFSEVSHDENHTYAYQLSRNDIFNMLGSDRAEEFMSKFAIFEVCITAYGKKLEEEMIVGYDQKTIDNQIKVIEKNIEDYKQLIIDEPEDKDYWEEQIKKCEEEIADLKSYKPLDEGIDGWDSRTGVIHRIDKYLHDNPEAEPPVGYIKRRSREYEQAASIYGDYTTTSFGKIDTDALIKYAKDHNLLNESRILCGEDYMDKKINESIPVKRLGAGGRKLTEAKKGFVCKYKGCSIHDMGDVFVATNSTGLNIGQSKTKAGIEGIIDEYVTDRSKSDPIKEDANSRGFYVTTYSPDERWSPEEGGTMDYGWDANRSKFFRTEQEAQAYLDDRLVGCNIISKYDGSYQYEDEYGDKHMIAIEPFHKRGQWHAPARSWAQIEFDDPVERPYFDRKGDRLARNPRLVAKEKRAAAELEREFLSIIDSATTRKEFIDSISDIKYSNLFSKHISTINDKWKSLKESAPICSESSEDAPLDVKRMDLEKVPSVLNWDVADQLQDCFRENKLWVDELHYNQVQDRIEFDINWGDWKHEHLRAKWLLQELFEKLGIEAEINSHTTEEDGSDTYSAHYNVYATKE